jgi:hypothetical protein
VQHGSESPGAFDSTTGRLLLETQSKLAEEFVFLVEFGHHSNFWIYMHIWIDIYMHKYII